MGIVGALARRWAGVRKNSFPVTVMSSDISPFECVQAGSGSQSATCSVSKTVGDSE